MPKLVTEFDGKIGGLTKAVSSAKMQLGSFAKNAASVGAGMAGFSGVEAVLGKIGGAISKAGNLSDAAANVGLSVEQYQKLGFAFRDVGLSSTEMEKTVATMNGKIGEAAQGNEAANESLNRLGLTYEGIKDLSPADQFEAIAKAISKLPTQAERAAAANDLFGKSGKKLDQLVMGFDAVIAKAEEAGNIIGGETRDAADRLGDEMAKLDDAFTALVANSGVIGFLTSLTAGMLNMLTTTKEGTKALIEMQSKLKETGARDTSTNGTYGGSDSFWGGLWNNFSEVGAFGLGGFEESEGMKITTNKSTTAERERYRKQQADKVRLAKEAAEKESKIKADADRQLNKKANDAVNTSDYMAEAYAKQQEYNKKEDQKAAEFMADSTDKLIEGKAEDNRSNIIKLKDMQEEIDLQKLINDGKAKEAAIQKAQDDMRKNGGTLDQIDQAGKLAADQFDISNIPKQQYMSEKSDALLRIGGSIGQGATPSGDNYARKQLTVLEELNRNLKLQTEKWEAANREKFL